MRRKVIEFLFDHPWMRWLLWVYYSTLGHCKFSGMKNNSFILRGASLFKSSFRFKGDKNTVDIAKGTIFERSKILIKGSNNKILIDEGSYINGLNIVLEGENNEVCIGKDFFVLDDTRLYVVDGSKLFFGKHCMLSDKIDIRTTDNHSIIDRTTHKRINYEKDVIIGDDVWIGTDVHVLKGTEIPEGCIIGAGTVITGKHDIPNSVIAGNPGREIKMNVEWRMERIK